MIELERWIKVTGSGKVFRQICSENRQRLVFRRRDFSHVMSLELLQCCIPPSPLFIVTLRLLRYPISLIHWPPRPSDLYPPLGRILGHFPGPVSVTILLSSNWASPHVQLGKLGNFWDGRMCLNIDCGPQCPSRLLMIKFGQI